LPVNPGQIIGVSLSVAMVVKDPFSLADLPEYVFEQVFTFYGRAGFPSAQAPSW
jgi:hypothetical protein